MFYCKKLPILQQYQRKVKAGVNAVQNFDSWAELSPVDYQEFSWKYINQIIEALADVTP
jgi:uroporphyrinogen decarboxylase